MFTDEERLACAVGELIHGVGNLLVNGKVKVNEIAGSDLGKELQELGDSLRRVNPSDSYPALSLAGIDVSALSPIEIVEVADSLLNNLTGHC